MRFFDKPFFWFKIMPLVALCLCVAACGKKPPFVEPPPDRDSSAYHQTYPDISTDPSPVEGAP